MASTPISKQDLNNMAAGPGGIDLTAVRSVNDLPSIGAYEGQTVLGKDDSGTILAFSWSGSRWARVGTVVGSPESDVGTATAPSSTEAGGGPSGRHHRVHNGKMYDYVFDVELSAGHQLQLCYTAGENIFDAAQRFINENSHAGVSQEDKETIQQFIMNHIDPADLRLVVGAGASSSGLGGGGGTSHAAAFSKFAQEEEARRRQGHGATKSYRERMAELDADGSQVAFSKFAQEAAARARGHGAQVVAAAGGGGGEEGSNVAAWIISSPTLVPSANFDTIRKKLAQLHLEKADETVDDVVACVRASSSSSTNTTSVLADAHRLVGSLLAHVAAAGDGAAQTFPILDLVRAIVDRFGSQLLVEIPEGNPTLNDLGRSLLTSVTQLVTDPASEAGTVVVALRLLSNLVVAEDATGSTQLGTIRALTHSHLFIAPPLLRSWSLPSSTVIKSACLLLASNVSFALCHSTVRDAIVNALADEGGDDGRDQLSILLTDLLVLMDRFALLESDSNFVIPALRVIVTLVRSTQETVAALSVGIADEKVKGSVAARKSYGHPDVVAIASYLYRSTFAPATTTT